MIAWLRTKCQIHKQYMASHTCDNEALATVCIEEISSVQHSYTSVVGLQLLPMLLSFDVWYLLTLFPQKTIQHDNLKEQKCIEPDLLFVVLNLWQSFKSFSCFDISEFYCCIASKFTQTLQFKTWTDISDSFWNDNEKVDPLWRLKAHEKFRLPT